jgi:hypothetical protein
MKPLRISLPALLIIAIATLWFSLQAKEAASLRNELQTLRAAHPQKLIPSTATEQPVSSEETVQLEREVAETRLALAREEAAVKMTEKTFAEIREKLPPVDDGETVVSFGRIADMGAETAQAIRGITDLVGQRDGTLAEKERIQASFMKLVAWMPEIAGFEEQPEEIASFQTAVFRDLFDLDETRSRQMESIIKQHFATLHAAGLHAANSAQPNWKERRAAALLPLLWQLRPFIPTDFKSPGVITQIVNIGAGMETKTQTHLSNEPGKSSHSVSMSLASWPRVPWLPTIK